MNVEIPSLPTAIILAGVSRPVDILSELPLPSPLPQTMNHKSLLFDPQVAEEAQRLLTTNNNNLIPQLVQSLSQTSSKHIDLKDKSEIQLDHSMSAPNAPTLLNDILMRNPDVFKGKQHDIESSHSHDQMDQMHEGMNNLSESESDTPQQQNFMHSTSESLELNAFDAHAQPNPSFSNNCTVNSFPSLPLVVNHNPNTHSEQLPAKTTQRPPIIILQQQHCHQQLQHEQQVLPPQPKVSIQNQNNAVNTKCYVGQAASTSKSHKDEYDNGKDKTGRNKKGEMFTSKNNLIDEQKKSLGENSASKIVKVTEVRKRKRNISEVKEIKSSPENVSNKKVCRVERMLVPVLEKLGNNILDNSTYYRFLKSMNLVLESISEDFDQNEDNINRCSDVSPELLIPKQQLIELCSEAAKFKALRTMETIPANKLVRLLTLLENNIREGCEVTPLANSGYNLDKSRVSLELSMESISRSVLSSLTALHILTSQKMPKRVYLEQLIDRIVIFAKFQLQNTIFPSFDPAYRPDRGGKDGFSSSNLRRRGQPREVREKGMISFYNKMQEVLSLLAELLNIQVLTDNTVLHLSTVGVSTFFIENVYELQLSALKLVSTIFTQYEQHRRLVLDDILSSISRLPSSKRSLRTFKLSLETGSGECIQMLTALVLQLIQCITHFPDSWKTFGAHEQDADHDKKSNSELDALIGVKYDSAMRTAGNFLAAFLSKCGSNKSEDFDYRVLFENFVQDLLSTVNKPQWPAAELLLSLLGNLLVKNLSNKNLDVVLRAASLEYIGVAAARLRKNSVSTHTMIDTIERIINDVLQAEENTQIDKDTKKRFDSDEEKSEFLQRLLLDYLIVNGQSDPSLIHARHFYIASSWKSAPYDIAKGLNNTRLNKIKRKKKNKKKMAIYSSDEESAEPEDSDGDQCSEEYTEKNSRVLQLSQKRKNFLRTKISDSLNLRKMQVIQTCVDYQSAEVITRYLASKRPFSATFDFFLKYILSVSRDNLIVIRTKALKCLAMIVEADPSVLGRSDMQSWVHNSFSDQSTAVREAAVDLVGKYVLSCHDLIDKYYETLSLRILDTGVSVRKRVIKILRDICIECPSFDKIAELCVKMIRRFNDEDTSVRTLVMEVFQNMWFSGKEKKENSLDTEAVERKVSQITQVVAFCEKVGLDLFEQLLLCLFKPKDDKYEGSSEKLIHQEPPKTVLTASTQIVNCLMEHVLRFEESNNDALTSLPSLQFSTCVATLHLFAKIRPQLLVDHATTLQGYLRLRCETQDEAAAITHICSILKLVVPLLVNQSESFLMQLEEDCLKLVFKNDKNVVESCLTCLSAVINKITHNYKLVRDIFRPLQSILVGQVKMIKENNQEDPKLNEFRLHIRRAIYTIGLVLRYFDFKLADISGDFPGDIVEQVFNDLIYVVEKMEGQSAGLLKYLSLQAIGNLCIRHYEFMLGTELKRVYQELLSSSAENKLKAQVLANIQLYLIEDELSNIKKRQESVKKKEKLNNIKEMDDITSGIASTIIQIYLKQILEAFLSSDLSVRLAAVRVIQLVLQQGLVHPMQIIPYLICMSTDLEQGVSATANKLLQEMNKKPSQHFLQGKVLHGMRLSLQLQRIINKHPEKVTPGNHPRQSTTTQLLASGNENQILIVRGFCQSPTKANPPSALNGFLYSMLRSTKFQRRTIVLSLLKQFEEQKQNQLADLLYYADNLAYFPYQIVEEPLFIIHQIDILISVKGSNLLQEFKECLVSPAPRNCENSTENNNPQLTDAAMVNTKAVDIMEDDDEEEDIDSLVKRVPEDTEKFEQCFVASQTCFLLLILKQHLKDLYGLTDTRISSYSPADANKTFERPVNHRKTPVFNPKCILANLRNPPTTGATADGRRALIESYLHFKEVML